MVVFLLLCLVVGICGWGTIFSVLGWIMFIFALLFTLLEIDWTILIILLVILVIVGIIAYYNMFQHHKNYEETGICDFRIHGKKYYARNMGIISGLGLIQIIDEELYELILKDQKNGSFQNWDIRAQLICGTSNYVVPKSIFYNDKKDIIKYIRTHNCSIHIKY